MLAPRAVRDLKSESVVNKGSGQEKGAQMFMARVKVGLVVLVLVASGLKLPKGKVHKSL